MFSVEATSPATSTRAPSPNSTPCGLISQTLPLLCRRPKICDGSPPTTRLSTWLAVLACWKSTVPPLPIENDFQLMMAPLLFFTVMVLLTVSKPAVPRITPGPCGRTTRCACAAAGPASVNRQTAANASGVRAWRERR